MRQGYHRPSGATTHIGARLSPLRKYRAQRLLAYLVWHGRKLFFDSHTFANVRSELELDRFEANVALDDLHALGLVKTNLRGDLQIVVALADSLEAAA